jgi:UDP-glucose 4-epimerase
MILVVGGAGYIGSHMVKMLRQNGERFAVFDNLEKGHHGAIAGVPFVQGDLRNPEDLRRAFAEHEVDLVMHFAALISVPQSVSQPDVYWVNNVIGVKNLLDAMLEAGCDKLVFSSTAAIYGEPAYNPVDEDHPKNPGNPYGATKLAAEYLIYSYDEAYKIKSVCLRYFNAAGADPEGELGSDHTPEEALVPVAILAAAGKLPGLKIYGADYDTPDGTAVRDYVHVWDLARAHMLAISHLRGGGDSRNYNLGNDKGFSVLEVIRTLEEVVGREIPKTVCGRRPGDAAQVVASSERIRRDWGWAPEYPELKTMIEHAWKWRASHPDGFRS